jgi:hypothetical protein
MASMAREYAKKGKDDRRPGKLRPVGALMHGLTKRALGKHGFSSAALIEEWDNVIGPELAATCQPVKLGFPPRQRDGGTLHIRADSGTALELQHLEPQIIQRVNAFLGYAAVARLAYIQAPITQRQIDARRIANSRPDPTVAPPISAATAKEIAAVDDPNLRASLERLGAAIRQSESRDKK